MKINPSDSGIQGEIIAAVEINPIANTVYKHNFPKTLILNNNIQSLSLKQIHKLNVNAILMSPPCQPFTRVGNQKDLMDKRTDAFKYICDILLPNLNEIEYILMENVKGFEKSKARDMYIECLQKNKYNFREFILSPTQIGIPNTRYRYYCLARRKKDFNFKQKDIHDNLNFSKEPFLIREILEIDKNIRNEFYLSDDLLKKRIGVLDIITSDDINSCCFTKAYTRYCEGTGSVFSNNCNKKQILEIFEIIEKLQQDSNEYTEALKKLKLRYFTPKEVSRLMSFPEEFSFPAETTNKQKYRLLGNSINVHVVGELLKILYF